MLGYQEKSVAGTGPAADATTISRGPATDRHGSGCPHDPVAAEGRTTADAAPSGSPLKLAALYARVSSDQQEKEQTIASQVDALQRAAQERGYHFAPESVFTDDGYTGARLDRPALDRLRDLAAEGAFETIFVYTPDRLARHYAYQVLLLEEFERVGCTMVFLNHAFGDSPEEQMLLQMQGVFAEYERAQIQERTRRGRLFAARQGRVNWGQNPTYGYRYLRKTENTPQQLIVEESEAAVVRQIYQWLVEEQMSSYAIQKRLTARQIPTRGHNQQGWAQSTVIEILRNPIYTGQTHYNRTQVADARRPKMARSHKDQRPGNGRGRVLRPKQEWIPVQVPAVIDPELWGQAQEQLARNREQATRNNTKHDYLLRSLLVCGQCGRRLVGTWSKLGQGRYVCLGRYPRSAAWSCDGRSLSAARAESQVWEYVSGLLSDADLLKARYDESRGDPAVVSREEREGERIERQLAVLKKEVDRLIDAYQAGVIELSQLQERRKRNEEHGRSLQTRLNELEQQRREREQEIRLLQSLEQFCASIHDALVAPSFETKQKMLQLVVDHILVEETKLTIRHIVPLGPVRLQTEQHGVVTPYCGAYIFPDRESLGDRPLCRITRKP